MVGRVVKAVVKIGVVRRGIVTELDGENGDGISGCENVGGGLTTAWYETRTKSILCSSCTIN